MHSEKDVHYLIAAKQNSLEGQIRALNPRDPDYKKKLKNIEDKIRRIPFEFGIHNSESDEI